MPFMLNTQIIARINEKQFQFFMHVCGKKYLKKNCKENEKKQLREYRSRGTWNRVHENGNTIQNSILASERIRVVPDTS